MDTSLRFSGDSRSLRIHAKQKLTLHSETRLQAHGELDTKLGGPTYFCALIRRFFPDISGSFGVGIQYTKREKIRYAMRGKKSFQVTTDGYVNFNIKGRCDVDQEFKQTKSRGGAEFCWDILNFQKDQDVRLKVGYEVSEKVPYVQIRENNWTLNADMKGRWNVRYDL